MIEKKMIRTFSELSTLKTFQERYEYLKLSGKVGESTFGFDRHLNQTLYNSKRWRRTRDLVIIRDSGLDLGVDGFVINRPIIVHHMNPLSIEDIELMSDEIFNPEFLICVSNETHQAIHYCDTHLLKKEYVPRSRGDTALW